MRLFIAIDFNKEVKDNLENIIMELKKSSIQGNFVDCNNLHVTLSFLGELESDQLVQKAMDEAVKKTNLEEFIIVINGLGKFKGREGNILWAGIEQNKKLYHLQKCLTQELKTSGFHVEDREYKPHLTLARKTVMETGFHFEQFSIKISPIEQKISKISLMKSEMVKGKLVYTKIYEKSLS